MRSALSGRLVAAGRLSRDPLVATLAVLTVVALAAAAWLGSAWISAARDDGLAKAKQRDTVLSAAEHGLVTLHTLDHRGAKRDVAAWLDVTAGGLHRDLAGDKAGQRERARRTKTVSDAELLRAAVTELNGHAGTAKVIAMLRTTLETKGEKSSTDRKRVVAELVRRDGQWKISAVEAAA
ncbi:hypothetical protein [Haloechinothrix salitolerans]|uniref:Mce-associated membrane protein n=1 Tax=Haloechinothrix salitolerans TaxID=926830 RepID=A0ABW2BXM8_9PSEU